ncbi:MAG: hypothetical protein AAGK14_12780 [Verrucomicrobiota bacterium]
MKTFVPLAFLSLALVLILGYQAYLNTQRTTALTQQLELLKAQEEQSALFTTRLSSIVNDLRQLAQTDPDAQAIVRRNITVQGQSGAQSAGGGQAPAANQPPPVQPTPVQQ